MRSCRIRLAKQRGIIAALYLYGLAAIAIIGGAYAIYHQIDSRGYQRGQAEVRGLWDAANTKAQAELDAQAQERARLAVDQSAKLATADARAREADTRWRQARAAAARAAVPLVVGECPQPDGGVATGASGPVVAGLRLATSIRFTYQLLYDADAAWTGADGEPVFGTSADIAARIKQPGSAPSAIGPEELLGNWQENASRCSADRRLLSTLTQTIIKLREQWDKSHDAKTN